LSSEARAAGVCPGVGAGVLLGLLIGSCADLERGPPPPDAAAASDAGDAAGGDAGISFARDVHALLLAGCARCHATGGEAADSGFVLSRDAVRDREQALRFVDSARPAASRLLSKTAGVGHTGGAIFPPESQEYATIARWIAQGTPP
jgi:hypothetical protein